MAVGGRASLTSASAAVSTPSEEGPRTPWGGRQDRSYPEAQWAAQMDHDGRLCTMTGLENSKLLRTSSFSLYFNS